MDDIVRDISKGFMWVTVKYEDGSYKYIYTTSNEDIAKQKGLSSAYKDTYLYDYRLNEWVNISQMLSYEISSNLAGKGDILSQSLYKYI